MTASNTTHRILVVEDEEHLLAGLKLNLELEGFQVEGVRSAREASKALITPTAFDLIILDVMLPDIDGFELCKRLRTSGNFTPVLMLTARSTAADRVEGLESGADDYLVKPFELSELLARVTALFRRRQWDEREATQTGTLLRFGDAEVNFETQEVLVDGEKARLTHLEFELLHYFASNPERVLSRQELLESVWKLRNYPNTRTVDNFIVRLRKHFEPNPKRPRFFISVRGAGYKFIPTGRGA